VPRPDADRDGRDFREFLNPESLQVLKNCRVEPSLAEVGTAAVQFERTGYFVADSEDSAGNALVFNRVVTLRDSWAKLEKQQAESG
jgi:glutaminyl-tRNA synthetase